MRGQGLDRTRSARSVRVRSTALVVGFVMGATACSLALDFDGRESRGDAGLDGSGVGSGDGSSSSSGDANASSSSGSTSSSSGGGEDGAAEAGNDCPGIHGPAGVRVGSFCIDRTEVSNADYAAFLADTQKTVERPEGCASATMDPDGFPGANAFPVVRINWCGAFAYCKWAGKRLCGKIGGGAADNVTANSQWFFACSNGGGQAFPYGTTFNAAACGNGAVKEVGTRAMCGGGFPGVFDMSGNVGEWEDSCSGTSQGSPCQVRGGGSDSSNEQDYACASDKKQPRSKNSDDFIGFRCCSP